MNFVYEDISKEDFEKFGIGMLAEKYRKKTFRKWSVNESKDTYALLVKDTTFMDDPDFGTGFYVMNIQGLWVDFETEKLAHGGVYKGETWTKFGITKVTPFTWNSSGGKQRLNKNELPIAHEILISMFCDSLAAESRWCHDESTKHEVFFENLTTVGVQS